jgi:hypothetical protein
MSPTKIQKISARRLAPDPLPTSPPAGQEQWFTKKLRLIGFLPTFLTFLTERARGLRSLRRRTQQILGQPFGKEGKERQENGGNPSSYKHFALLTDPDVGREEVGSGTLGYLELYSEAFFGSGGLCRISVSYQEKYAVSDDTN